LQSDIAKNLKTCYISGSGIQTVRRLRTAERALSSLSFSLQSCSIKKTSAHTGRIEVIVVFRILVAEDDQTLRRVLCAFLSRNGYSALQASDGQDALDVLEREHVDLIISDVMMPRMDGYELIRELRDAGYTIPVLIVTVKENFEDKEKGFLAGADDYMVKPIDMNEMLLRVGALLRRAKISNEHRLTLGSTVLDYDSLTVTTGTEEAVMQLPQKEFYLLFKLLSYNGKIFTRAQLMDEIWGIDSETDERTVDVHINRLRDRFRDNPDFSLVTVRGLGYKAVKTVE